VLNVIHWRGTCCWQADADGFVRLKYDNLTTFISPAVWKKVRALLTDASVPGGPVIECDRRYVIGEKSYGYRLAAAYLTVRRTVCTDPELNRKIWQYEQERDRALLPVHHGLRDHLGLLEFDAALARRIVATMHPDPSSELTLEEYRDTLTGICHRIADGDRRLVCDRYSRVHTPVTSLPRGLRRCLSVAGEPLVGWDVKNSQPLMAGLLACRFVQSKDARHRLGRAKFAGIGNPYCYESLGRTAGRDALPADLVAYLGSCERGEFYESFGGDRDRVKRAMLTILMGPNNYRSPIKAAFEDKYPTVAEMLETLKRKDHRRAAWLLQNLEATLVIYGACRLVWAKWPDLPVYTIHDCLYTVPSGKRIVHDAILEAFARAGVQPRLEFKP
jgi:hypothetical protein